MTRATREYTDLRTANVDRQSDWCPDQKPDLAFRGCEISGEVGELCELLVCGNDGGVGFGDWFTDLQDEIGDCVISLDLMGICVGLPPLTLGAKPVALSRNPTHLEFAANLGWRAGELANVAKKLERERHGWRGSRSTTDDLLAKMYLVAGLLNALAEFHEIDMAGAVATKFNATSEKVDLPHRLVLA